MKRILVVGGAGYIGSHMVRLLLEHGLHPVVFDINKSGKKITPKGAVWVNGDLRNAQDLRKVFKAYPIDTVMHFGGQIVVPESTYDPLKYYDHNVLGTINLLKSMQQAGVNRIIFSSTAAVYGDPLKVPIQENALLNPLSPYGQTKLMMEQVLKDVAAADKKFSYMIFRYFNAAGAHESGLIGESHDPETHLIPNVLKAVKGEKKLFVYGDDYKTKDGTCIRDYIHVQDICDAHYLALKAFNKGIKNEIVNLGSGRGFSIFEIIRMVERVTAMKVKFTMEKRRAGDCDILIASSKKARTFLGWEPKRDLQKIVESAWAWEK